MNKVYIIVMTATVLFSSSCSSPFIIGATVSGIAMKDNRSWRTSFNDQAGSHKLKLKLNKNFKKDNIRVYSFNGNILLVGQTSNENHKIEAEKYAKQLTNAKKVFNEIKVSKNSTLPTNIYDLYIYSKANIMLLLAPHLSSSNIKCVCEAGELYLMGDIRVEDANIALETVRSIDGVKHVYSAFTYLTEYSEKELNNINLFNI